MVRRYPRKVVQAADEGKILGVRAGSRSDHRFVGVWMVVVDGRIFARSWTLTRGGWYHTLLADPVGTIQIGARELRVRARPVRGERVLDAIETAYAAKYDTPGARKYVRGFRAPRRRAATIEFVPR